MAAANRIGVVGAGRMGLPIAGILHDSGFDVGVFDTDRSRRDAAGRRGLRVASGIPELAGSVDVLLTILPDGEAVHAELPAVLGLTSGTLWIDLSSGDPRLTESGAAEARAKGVETVAATMSGGPAQAEAGELGFFVSGPPAAIEAALPLLEPLARSGGITTVGDNAADAQVVKLLANLLWFGQVVAATEALLLGVRLGVDVRVLRDTLATSAGGSAFLDRHVDRLLAGDYMEDFGLDGSVAELRTVTELAHETGTPAQLMELVTRLHEDALQRFGPVPGELLVARLLEEQAGTRLRHDSEARYPKVNE